MARLQWDRTGERIYETGVDHGVLYLPDSKGRYVEGYTWNGLTTVTEAPSGAESNPQYADNIKYINLISAEEFGATIEAFTYPEKFAECDGTAIVNGVLLGQQRRRPFGLSYRSLVGNDLDGTEYGYKIHLVYGAQAAPSEKAYATVNDSPEAITFSWEVTTNPVEVGVIDGKTYKPSASLTIDSTKVDAEALKAFEDILYGTDAMNPRMPQPREVIEHFAGTTKSATPTAPTFDSSTGVITIPTVTGVEYFIDGEVVTDTYTVPDGSSETVVARPKPTYKFPDNTDDDWVFVRP